MSSAVPAGLCNCGKSIPPPPPPAPHRCGEAVTFVKCEYTNKNVHLSSNLQNCPPSPPATVLRIPEWRRQKLGIFRYRRFDFCRRGTIAVLILCYLPLPWGSRGRLIAIHLLFTFPIVHLSSSRRPFLTSPRSWRLRVLRRSPETPALLRRKHHERVSPTSAEQSGNQCNGPSNETAACHWDSFHVSVCTIPR